MINEVQRVEIEETKLLVHTMQRRWTRRSKAIEILEKCNIDIDSRNQKRRKEVLHTARVTKRMVMVSAENSQERLQYQMTK